MSLVIIIIGNSMKIRKAKKVIKKSNGFISVRIERMIFPINEWDILVFHSKGISVNESVYIPYSKIGKIIVENYRLINNL